MGKAIDITGQRFGRLVAMQIASVNPRKWLCQCDCGERTQVRASDLMSGNTKSCGCAKRDYEDLSGVRFDRLVAQEYKGSKDGVSMWLCKCDCGGTVTTRSSSLKYGNTRSCGCLASEKNFRCHDTVDGTRLSMLSAEAPTTNTSGVRGVSYSKRRNRYEAYIKIRGSHIHLGIYKTLEEAAEARKKAEEDYYHPILEKHGIVPDDGEV